MDWIPIRHSHFQFRFLVSIPVYVSGFKYCTSEDTTMNVVLHRCFVLFRFVLFRFVFVSVFVVFLVLKLVLLLLRGRAPVQFQSVRTNGPVTFLLFFSFGL